MVLLSAQRMPVVRIAEVTFTSADRVRDVIHNFNEDGFDSLYPRYAGGRPKTFTLPERREIKKIAVSSPANHALPFPAWSLSKLAEFLVAEGVVDDISHEGLRALLHQEGVSFQKVKTWKASKDPDYAGKKARTGHLYAVADGGIPPAAGDPDAVICVDEFGPRTSRPARGTTGLRGAAGTRTRAGNRGPGAGRPTSGTKASGSCSPPTTWPGTGSADISRRPGTASNSWNSAATCTVSTRRRSASESCATTTSRT